MSENIWFTSDNHFGHKNVLNFCRATRKGSDIEEMHALMIARWNATVSKNDRVYCLGDFSLMRPIPTGNILAQLHGQIHLIRGNHDNWITTETAKNLVAIHDYKKIKIDNTHVVLFHFPIFEWDHIQHGAFHLYGHVHGGLQLPGRAMDVGIDARPQGDMGLWAWEEVRANLMPKEIRPHHKSAPEA